MCLFYYKLSSDLRWRLDKYEADGIYITDCYKRHSQIHTFIDNDLCYYNYLTAKPQIAPKTYVPTLNQVQSGGKTPLQQKHFMKSLF
jgi:hypothetical protein